MTTAILDLECAATVAPDLAEIYAANVDFVWASLQRLGVRDDDLRDLAHDVFVVVQRRLGTYDGRSAVRTWLFGICLRVAAAHRRRAYVRRERAADDATSGANTAAPGESPEDAAAHTQRRARLHAILDELEPERRAVFVMFEVEELACEAIAAMLGVPVGTVYSRLHRAS